MGQRWFWLTMLPLAATFVRAQSVFVDIDDGFGADVGGGSPSAQFSGAAPISGFWNCVQADYQAPVQLADVNGHALNVFQTSLGGGGGFGFRNATNHGDYALLLNDAERIDPWLTYTISGLEAGPYEVISYAVQPQGGTVDVAITVSGAGTNPQHVTGPMPGDGLIEGITHSIHYIDLAPGENLTIRAEGGQSGNNAYFNGYQIVALPEPISISALVAGVAWLALSRRRRV